MGQRGDKVAARRPQEMVAMVRKELCPHCKGERYIQVKDVTGRVSARKCPHCQGQGYKVRMR